MRTLKTFIITTFTAVLIVCSGFRNEAKAQFFFGGDVSATFVNGLNIDLAPTIGYKIQHLSIGVSPVVMYAAGGTFGGDFSFGGRLFAEYDVYKGFLAHAEVEILNSGYVNTSGVRLHGWNIGAPIGVGYEHKIMDHVMLKALVLYDVLQNINLDQSSPKANPQVRGGITYVL